MIQAIKAARAGGAIFLGFLAASGLVPPDHVAAETITLRNGLIVEGASVKVGSLGADPTKAAAVAEGAPKQIVLVDDQLTRTFFGSYQLAAIANPPAPIAEKFKIEQRVANVGRAIGGVGPIVRITPFDEWGRRIFTMSSSQGTVDIVQGITEITPTYTKVEAIQGAGSYVWTMRIATSSIPRETLSKVLYHVIDVHKSDDRLKIVRLYLQSERIQDARAELEQLLKDFPNLAHLQDLVKALRQQGAQRLLKEVELRKSAGQYQRAIVVLEQFPADGIAGETLLKVRETLDELAQQKAQGDRVQALLKLHLEKLEDENVRESLQPIIGEIAADLNVNTLDRMADYLRLSDDPNSSTEQNLSLAISGWLMGNGSGLDNLPISRSLVEVRDLVRKYLASTRKPERDVILAQLESLEGATPANVAKILAHMKPPLEATVSLEAPTAPEGAGQVLGLETPPAAPAAGERPAAPLPPAAQPPAIKPAAKPAVRPAAARLPLERGGGGGADKEAPKKNILDDGPAPPQPRNPLAKDLLAKDPAAPPPAAPADAAAPESAPAAGPLQTAGIPGMYRRTVAGLPEEPKIEYDVQLPPEYDPYRRYPCIVTLHGSGTSPQQQIDWWAGGYNPDVQTRFGQASRHGYIVIAPRWAREHQRKYEFSAREHAAALFTLRDACKLFAIDTDRVFLSGHSMGGDAAWDIGLAHPDIWAGVIPIVATADKYVTRYWENGRYVPMYFVCGEKDGNKMALNSIDWDRYLTKVGFDVMITQYQGRGHEHFHDEVQQIFDWMNLHKRDFFPKKFKTTSLRPWDNYFWYVETADPLPANMVLPAAWPKKATPAEVEAEILPTNAVRVSSTWGQVTVYLTPEMISFENRVAVMINGKRQLNIQPNLTTLLEDARTRADRQHPFWAKVSN